MSVRLAVVGLLVCLSLGAFTTHKLYKMARIRGYVGSPEIVQQIVTDKRAEEARGRRGSTRVSMCVVLLLRVRASRRQQRAKSAR